MDKLIKTLPAILKASGASEEVAEAACIAAWRHAVGEGLGGHAVPVQLQNNTLVVVVADNIWKNQLDPMRSQLLFRLNAVLGRAVVNSIELRVDSKTLSRVRGPATTVSSAEAGKSKKSDYKVSAELLSAAAEIEDADLRRAFLGAAMSCVRRLEGSEI